MPTDTQNSLPISAPRKNSGKTMLAVTEDKPKNCNMSDLIVIPSRITATDSDID